MSDWTIDELARRAAEALASDGVRAPNGRVTAVPDRRVIRWYATIGLLDRPLRTGGRTARYGPRHLRQLVAVKRRQAQGRALAEIQAELAGATDATLSRVAGLPDPPQPSAPPQASSPPSALSPSLASRGDGARERFWAETPESPKAPPAPAPAPASAGPLGPPEPVYPLPLDRAATLVLRARPGPDDLPDIRAAARPLLDLLSTRGLLAHDHELDRTDPPRRLR